MNDTTKHPPTPLAAAVRRLLLAALAAAWCLAAPAQTRHEGQLRQMARQLGLAAQLDTVQPGRRLLTATDGRPIAVQTDERRQLLHLGLPLFADDMRQLMPMPVYDFLEYAALTEHYRLLPNRLHLRRVIFRTGSWATLAAGGLDTCACTVGLEGGRLYVVAWHRGPDVVAEVGVPADYELLGNDTRHLVHQMKPHPTQPMKHLIATAILLLATAFTAKAQTDGNVTFTIVDGIADQRVKRIIEENVSLLLSEIGRASAADRPLRLDHIAMQPSGRQQLQRLWANLHFSCDDGEYVERCITSADGFSIRNIYVTVEPKTSGYNDELERAITISLTRDGRIASVVLSASDETYARIMRDGVTLTDMARREQIVNFVENYRSHYDEKDIDALRQVFSDDALIITGSVAMKRDAKSDSPKLKNVVYRKQTKKEYLTNLEANFRRNKYIKVTFTEHNVIRHPTNPDFYAVTVRQHWESTNYSDDGYLVLIWEFREGQDPIIHVRTWQDDKVIAAGEEVINIMDFEIPNKY